VTNVAAPLSVAVRTDTGKVRANNEDSWGTRWLGDGSLLVVVADGMGGHAAGEVASKLAIDVLGEVVAAEVGVDPRARIREGFLKANEAIIEEGRRAGRRGMGTTGVVALVAGDRVHVGQVGDSRLFHVREGRVVWRTTDHTRVQVLIDRGVIQAAEARNHADSGVLTRALGHARMSNGEALVPEVRDEALTLLRGDALVLCTDGLHDLLDDDEIAELVAGCTAEEGARRLVELALERGGHDNVTVAVVVAGERASGDDVEDNERAAEGTSWEDDEPTPRPDQASPAAAGESARGRRAAADGVGAGEAGEARSDEAKGGRVVRAAGATSQMEPAPAGEELPWWFWPSVMLGVGMLALGAVMLGVAVWLLMGVG
jgi:serine/threonine protein phosphatase PrpC